MSDQTAIDIVDNNPEANACLPENTALVPYMPGGRNDLADGFSTAACAGGVYFQPWLKRLGKRRNLSHALAGSA